MPSYDYVDEETGAAFHAQAPDVPPDLEFLIGRNAPMRGCSCDDCSRAVDATLDQWNRYGAILTAQREAQNQLEAFVARCRADRTCSRCHDRYTNDTTMVELSTGTVRLCRYCRQRVRTCDQCNRLSTNLRHLHDGCWACAGCLVDPQQCWCGFWYDLDIDDACPEPVRYVHQWNYRPSLVFHTLGDGTDVKIIKSIDRTPYLGFELEVEFDGNHDQAAQAIADTIDGIAYLKEDGSVSAGFELVTHPMTYDYAVQRFPWQVLADMAEVFDGTAEENCGLHVHVSKAAFATPSHEYRWLLFWHRNQRVMRRLARRDSADYAAWTDEARRNAKRVAKKQDNGQDLGRYMAINTINRDTHEVRIFASTLDVSQVQAALALVAGSVEYTRRLDSNGVLKASGWLFDTFAAWAAKQPQYRPLSAQVAQMFPNGTAYLTKNGSK